MLKQVAENDVHVFLLIEDEEQNETEEFLENAPNRHEQSIEKKESKKEIPHSRVVKQINMPRKRLNAQRDVP